jgi:hypothetical protein
MSKKVSKKRKSTNNHATGADPAQEQKRAKKASNLSGIVLGVIIALVIFSLSGGSSNTRNWTEATGTIVDAYELTEADGDDDAGFYADIDFVTTADLERTERSKALKTDLSDEIGSTVDIKYNPDGTGVLVVGNVKSSGNFSDLEFTDILFIVGAIAVISGIGVLIKRFMPTQEQYNAKHPKQG